MEKATVIIQKTFLDQTVLDQKTWHKAKILLEKGTSASSRRALSGDLYYFWAWAELRYQLLPVYPIPLSVLLTFVTDHLQGLPPDIDAKLVENKVKTRLGPHTMSTVERRLASLATWYRLQGIAESLYHPQLRELLKKARRAVDYRPHKKDALVKQDLKKIAAIASKDDVRSCRDLALLFFAFASGGRRRSEVAQAHFEDLRPVAKGFVYHLRRSKTDQDGVGRYVPILGQASLYLQAWLERRGRHPGALFHPLARNGTILKSRGLCDKSVSLIIKNLAVSIGLPKEKIGGHSVRRGFVTESGRQGIAIPQAMALTGHKSVEVFMGYYQEGNVEDNPAASLLDDAS
jgi:integrase